MSSILLSFSFVIIVVHSGCSTSSGLICASYQGKSGDTSKSCKDSTEILVSCGIFIDPTTNYISRGVEMTDNKCNIVYTNTSETPKPIPIARCCQMDPCYEAQFECELNVKRQQSSKIVAECATYKHLFSCGVQQKFEPNSNINNTYQGIWFSNGQPSQGKHQQMLDHYCTLFAMDNSVCGPSPSPTTQPTATSKPTSKPTNVPTKNNTNSPTTNTNNPTIKPSQSPTTNTKSPTLKPSQSPTISPTPDSYNQSDVNYCQLERFDGTGNTEYLWLFSLCCSETTVTSYAPTSTTSIPSISPSNNPTIPTLGPTVNIFGDAEAGKKSEGPYPNLGDKQPEQTFDDTENGYLTFIHWGVSNINRTYQHVAGDYNNGIQTIKDKELVNDYYFTIKNYKGKHGEEFSEYGKIYLAKDGSKDLICPDVDIPTSSSDGWIVKVHTYINDTTKKIEGMTMFQASSTTASKDIGTSFTCHIQMAIANNNSQAFQDQLYAADKHRTNNTADVSSCAGAGLAGFQGSAPGLGIEQITFVFIGCSSDDETTKNPTTLRPSIVPTPAPTISPTTAITSTASSTQANSKLDLKCYWVMGENEVSCLSKYKNNPSFMTNCIGYSITEQPNSWYINDNNTCVVTARGGEMDKNMAAIATCCRLNAELTDCEKNGITWTTNSFFCKYTIQLWFVVVIVGGLIGILLIWVGFIIFCCITNRKIAEADEKLKRLRAPPVIIPDIDGEQIALFTDEQIEDRLSLGKFQVNDEIHQEMLQEQRLISSQNIGLEAD